MHPPLLFEVNILTEAIVRPPHTDERGSFFQVYETGIPFVDGITFDGFSRWWNRSRILGDIPSLWRVATVDNQIVGVAINLILGSLGWGAIWELAVAPNWRSQGIGSKLVSESERALLLRNQSLTHFAIGVKASNIRALPFIERMGYGVQSLILKLEGDMADRSFDSQLEVKIPRLEHIPMLLHLNPDNYWDQRDHRTLEYAIRGGNCYVLADSQTNMLVGFFRFEFDHDYSDSTVISFSYRDGYGKDVVNAALNEVSSRRAVLWVQDKHEEILDHLYSEGFHRVDAEFLAKKRVHPISEDFHEQL